MSLRSVLWIAFGLLAIAASACTVPTGGRVIGGQPVGINEMAEFPGAGGIDYGQSKIIEPLFAEAMNEPTPFIGLGIEVDKTHRTFQVPPATTFADVKSFYADKLQAAGWREDGVMRVFMDAANKANPNLQGAEWVRIDQTLLIILATDPASGNRELTLSLATH